MPFIDILDGTSLLDIIDGRVPPSIKRGDIVQSNVGDHRERTWMVLSARLTNCVMSKERCRKPPRYQVWMARWWELEPDFRIRLFRSAERNGGQRVINFKRYPAKKKITREQIWKDLKFLSDNGRL